jgi:PAS domain S-box-containing protein
MKEFIQRRFFVSLIFGFSLLIFLLISYVSYENTELLKYHTQQVRQSNENLLAYESFLSIMKDAETGQRGYLLTRDSTYLTPYTKALDSVNVVIGRVRHTVAPSDSLPQKSLHNISRLVRRNLFLLESNIRRRRVQGLEASIDYLTSGSGKVVMDSLRQEVQYLESLERQKLSAGSQMVETSSAQASFTHIMGTVVSILLLVWAFWILRQQMQKRKEALELLELSNQELEAKVKERTREIERQTEELANRNEAILASNEQLSQALARLDQTQRQLELALESARMGSWRWDLSSNEIAWSGTLEEIHGLKSGEFKERYGGSFEGYQRLIHPNDLPLLRREVEKALQKRTVYDLEFRYLRPDGSIGWMLGRGKGEYDAEGKATAMQGIGMDITERKRAEERLRESEAKLRRLYDVGLMGVNYWRKDGKIIDSNDYFLQMIGYSREELAQGEINWRKLTLPGYEKADAQAKQEIDTYGYCRPYEKEYRCKDGHIINVLLGAASLEDESGEGIAFLLDITERKTAEEQLRTNQILLQTIFEAAADALFLVNAQTELIEQYNQQAVLLFEFNDKQEYVGKRGPNLENRPYADEERKQIQEQIRCHNYWSTEIEFTGKKGRSFWGNVAVSFFQIEEKGYYLIRVRDVTERRTIYEEVKRSQEELLKEKRKTEQHLAIIEEDNKRKTRELEEARELQFSMLPQEAPELPYIAMASYMKTCVEVGGDYYDYKVGEDGTLTFIVGDATGHGLKAGIIVATVKSYFQTLAGQCDVVELLQRISEGIRNLQIRAMYMGVTVIEIRDTQMKIASSGMPPLYLYRHHTYEVEAITLKGPFLGSTLPTPYHHVTRPLQPGDALLILTDGLPELFNKERQMLDLPAIRKAFHESAHLPPQKIIDSITQLAETWANGQPNEDDITLLVLKAR